MNKFFTVPAIVVLIFLITTCRQQPDQPADTQTTVSANPLFDYVPIENVRLNEGLLADRCMKNINNLYLGIDPEELKAIYAETHDPWYAEPEFLGHWLTAGPPLFDLSGMDEIRSRNEEVLQTVLQSQRPDGYLGSYHPGLEFDYTFSVWNQNFMIKGLLAQYEATGNRQALEAATRCADYIATAYLKSDSLDLLFGLNQGIQHATILEEMTHLYMLTDKELYLDFSRYIVDRLENSSIQVVSIPNRAEFWAINFMMGCTKGIEMFNIYFGILNMYRITGEEKYLQAARQYWKNLKEIQIRITGNGTIGENWNHLGNTPIDLTNDMRPNENCVAMGWMKFNAELAGFTGESMYVDEMEKTLYNHLLGSQALNGHDFSYYQGNIGHKVHAKDPGAYSCCRYRGMRILSYLPGYIYMQDDKQLAVNLFSNSEAEALIRQTPVRIIQETDYPKSGRIDIRVKPEKDISFSLLLRKPEWCEDYALTIDGKAIGHDTGEGGYLRINRIWPAPGSDIRFELQMNTRFIPADINGEPRVAVKYGPLILAIDSRYGTPIEETTLDPGDFPALVPLEIADRASEGIPQVAFSAPGTINGEKRMITLVDYASAGSLAPGRDEFRVWIPLSAGF